MRSPVSRIVPKNVKGDLWNFLNIHSVAKYQKIKRGTLWSNKKDSEKNEKFEQSHKAEKRESLIVSKKVEKGALLLWNGFLSHVRGFGCVEKNY